MALDRMSPFDRVPPQNLEAEQAVLGSMLIERPAVEKAAEILKADDFYRDAHRYIFEAMLGLAERDEPVDILTVMAELNGRDRGELAGGRFYLQNLMEAPATAANIEYYAKMVEEKAILRKLMDVGTQIQGLAYSEFNEVDEVVDRAEKLVFEIGQRRMGQFFYHIRPLLDEELDRIEKRYENKGTGGGRMTPFDDLNFKTNGLNPSDLIIVAARPGMGKCLPDYTLIDNPLTGERQTLEQCIRERLPVVYGVSETGKVRVTAVSDWIDSGIQPCYRVRTRTGRSVDVTGHHPFLAVQGWTPLHCLEVGNKIGVPRAVPCFGQDDDAPGLARLMAYFLAEGGLSGTSPRFTNVDPVIVADFKAQVARHFPECAVKQYGIDYEVVKIQRSNRPNPVTVWLRDLKLMGKKAEAKRFPACVWTWNRERLAEFLRVLFSCDGTIYSMGGYARIEFAVASEMLAGDAHHVLTRFGIVSKFWRKSERCWRVEITEPQSVAAYQQEIGWYGEKATRVFRSVNITQETGTEPADARRSIVGHPPQEVWSLVRAEAAKAGISLSELARRCGEKGAGKDGYNPHTNRSLPRTRLAKYAEVLQSERLRQIASADLYWDEIVSIEAIGSHQVYDLTVPDGANFIAQDVCVHNTSLTVQLAQYIAMNENVPVAIFSLEMSKEQLVTRMICSESKVDASRLRNGSLQGEDWQRVGEGISRLADAPIYIDDSPDISAMEMRAKCRRLKAEQGLGLIVIDYLQLMRSHKKTDNRTQEISEIARACKQLARELRVPVIALSQLSRAVESRPDKRPMLSDLRESGSIEAEADIVMFIYRDAYYKAKEEGAEEQQGNRDYETLEETELILAKHRSGPTGKVFVGFIPKYTRFENMTDRAPGDLEE